MPQIEPGNIDLHNRPIVHNPDGSISTVRSASFEIDGQEVLLPTVSDDGRNLTDDEAVALYKLTGRHLGKFTSPEEATAYAQSLHQQQEQEYVPQAMTQQQDDPALLEELLRQKGLLATGGNIRSLPFAGSPETVNGTAASLSGSNTPPGSGESVPRPPGPSPVVDPNNGLVDATTGKPIVGPIADDWWKYLLAGGAIAGGAALVNALRNKMGGRTSKIPTVEGEVLDPLAPNAMPDAPIVEGEYSDVSPVSQIDNRRALPAPDTPAPPSPAQVIAERKLGVRNRPGPNPTASSDTSVVRSGDALNDLTDEEIGQAWTITQQLIDERTKGNATRAKQTNLTRRGGKPTGPTEPPESLFNTVVRIMRENGALRSAARKMH